MDFNRIDEEFLVRCPEGLNDPIWIGYFNKLCLNKVKEIIDDELSQTRMEELIESQEFDLLAKSILKTVNKSPVLSRFEKLAFKNYINEIDTHEPLSLALYDLLYHFDESAFERMVNVLGMYIKDKEMNVLKWPMITFFNVSIDPKNYILVKPKTVKATAKGLGIDVEYTPRPNYRTYINVLNMTKNYKDISNICKGKCLRTAQEIMYIASS